ncbi:hypothetical protein FS837_003993, partial [Tulasnella sp. UAMH 9824]
MRRFATKLLEPLDLVFKSQTPTALDGNSDNGTDGEPREGARTGGKAKVVQATYKRRGGYWDEGEVVAVKKLHYSQRTDKTKFSNEFTHEVEVMAGLSHENIVRLIGFVENLKNGEAWMVLPWYPNGNVGEFIAKGDWELPERVSL